MVVIPGLVVGGRGGVGGRGLWVVVSGNFVVVAGKSVFVTTGAVVDGGNVVAGVDVLGGMVLGVSVVAGNVVGVLSGKLKKID